MLDVVSQVISFNQFWSSTVFSLCFGRIRKNPSDGQREGEKEQLQMNQLKMLLTGGQNIMLLCSKCKK